MITSAVGLIVGFALFGALTYLPLFQQIVRGLSPTASGLQLLPVMGGLLISSIVSGQIISRVGRYKVFPIAGTAVAALGMFLLSSLDATTATGVAALHMLVLGLGLGMVMQVLVLAVQNAVPYEMLGVATSGATLFRSIGGSLGIAVLGAIFTGRLTSELPTGAASSGRLDPSAIHRLPAAQRDVFINAFTDALQLVFTGGDRSSCSSRSSLSWLIPERPLRKTVETTASATSSAARSTPTRCASSRARSASRSAASGRWRSSPTPCTARASTSPRARRGRCCGWGRPTRPRSTNLAARPHVRTRAPAGRGRGAARARPARGRAADRGGPRACASGSSPRAPTGCGSLVADWEPDQNPELDPLLRRLADELAAPA